MYFIATTLAVWEESTIQNAAREKMEKNKKKRPKSESQRIRSEMDN